MAIQCITGSGRTIGDALVSQPNVRKVTFTGSREIGERITKMAGTQESDHGARLELAVDRDARRRHGQSSGSDRAERIRKRRAGLHLDPTRHRPRGSAYGDYIDALKPQVEALAVGDPKQDAMNMGPLVRETDAARVESWVNEAVEGGANLVSGGTRNGAIMAPTILADVDPGHADFARRGVRTSCGDHSGGRH